MHDDLQLIKNIEGAHAYHAFLALPPAAYADHISILFFQATVAVECFTPTPIIPLISFIKQHVLRNAADHRILFSKSWLRAWTTLRC
jgi:hypothetical protein